MTLDEARDNIGRRVLYWPTPTAEPRRTEIGVITSVNEIYAHVRFGGDIHSKATRPEDLGLLKR